MRALIAVCCQLLCAAGLCAVMMEEQQQSAVTNLGEELAPPDGDVGKEQPTEHASDPR